MHLQTKLNLKLSKFLKGNASIFKVLNNRQRLYLRRAANTLSLNNGHRVIVKE